MPVVRDRDQLPWQREPDWARQDWAGAVVFGEPVPMAVRRYQVTPGAAVPRLPLGGQEAMVYVIAGAGTATAGGDQFPLAPESVLWLAACGAVTVRSGPGGLDLLVAESTGGGGAPPEPLRTVLAAADLPHLVSTRDSRDRLDLVTENVPVGASRIRADRIVYHPGDTAAPHYHTDCHHVFCVLSGSGLLYSGGHAFRLRAGMSALVGPGEEHWFENDQRQDFSFAEFWAPPPSGTVWTVGGDRCTWAPDTGTAARAAGAGQPLPADRRADML